MAPQCSQGAGSLSVIVFLWLIGRVRPHTTVRIARWVHCRLRLLRTYAVPWQALLGVRGASAASWRLRFMSQKLPVSLLKNLAPLPGYVSNYVPRAGTRLLSDFGGYPGPTLRRLSRAGARRAGRGIRRNPLRPDGSEVDLFRHGKGTMTSMPRTCRRFLRFAARSFSTACRAPQLGHFPVA